MEDTIAWGLLGFTCLYYNGLAILSYYRFGRNLDKTGKKNIDYFIQEKNLEKLIENEQKQTSSKEIKVS